MLPRTVIIAAISLFLFINCGVRSNRRDLPDRMINVVTTTGMIGDAAKRVGGVRVLVKALMGSGVDPHLYKASEGDVIKMAGADIIFYNGLHLEGKRS